MKSTILQYKHNVLNGRNNNQIKKGAKTPTDFIFTF